MKNKDTNTDYQMFVRVGDQKWDYQMFVRVGDQKWDYQMFVRVGDQKWEIVKITIGTILFAWDSYSLFFIPGVFNSHMTIDSKQFIRNNLLWYQDIHLSQFEMLIDNLSTKSFILWGHSKLLSMLPYNSLKTVPNGIR